MTTINESQETWYCASASGAYTTRCDGCQKDTWHRYTGETSELGHEYECVECWDTVIEPALDTASGEALR